MASSPLRPKSRPHAGTVRGMHRVFGLLGLLGLLRLLQLQRLLGLYRVLQLHGLHDVHRRCHRRWLRPDGLHPQL